MIEPQSFRQLTPGNAGSGDNAVVTVKVTDSVVIRYRSSVTVDDVNEAPSITRPGAGSKLGSALQL